MLKNYIYDYFVVKNYTELLNKHFLTFIPANSYILDIGIGTGSSMISNTDLIKSKNIKITGVDIDEIYLSKCRDNIKKYDLSNHIDVKNNQEFFVPDNHNRYDFILFSDSYAVIPDVHDLINSCKKYLTPNGRIVIITTLDQNTNEFKRLFKSSIYYFTTIDFGKVTTVDEFKSKINDINHMHIELFDIILTKTLYLWGNVESYMIFLK